MMYRTRRDAERDARIAIWGDLPVGKRPMLYPEVDLRHEGIGIIGTYVTADVNGRDVVFDFDNYGRTFQVIVLDKGRTR